MSDQKCLKLTPFVDEKGSSTYGHYHTSYEVSCQLLTNDLNRGSSVSLLITALTALANEGLFELARRPSLTRAVSLPFADTTKEPGCSQVKKLKFDQI